MKCPERPDFQRSDAVGAVIHGARRAGEMKNVIDFAHIEGLADIFLYEFEPWLVVQVRKIRAPPRQQIIDDDDLPAFAEQCVAQMRSQKSGTASHYRAFLAHAFLPFFKTAAGTPSGCDASRPTL